MRIIILGGTGYLGKKMVQNLVKDNELLCVVRKESNIKRFDELINKLSICEIDDLDNHLKSKDKYDCVINFACRYSRNSEDADVFEANLYNPLKVIITCLKNRVNKIITIDTGLTKTLNAYSFSKSLLADSLKWYCEQNNELQIYNIKMENYYGPDEPTDRFIPQTIIKLSNDEKILLTEGTQIRDFIHIEDVIQNLIKIIKLDLKKGFYDIPLGTGEGVSIKELMTYLKQIMNSKSELCFGAIKMRKNEPDSVANKEIMNRYNITVQYHWKEGMKKIIKGYL